MTGFQMKEKVVEGDPFVANIRKHTAFSHFQPADLAGIDWTGVDHLHVTGIPLALSQSCRETIYTLMMRAHSKGVRISFDPNLRPMLWKSEHLYSDGTGRILRTELSRKTHRRYRRCRRWFCRRLYQWSPRWVNLRRCRPSWSGYRGYGHSGRRRQ